MNYKIHSYSNDNISFEYSVPYSNKEQQLNITLELYRGKLFCYIIKEFISMSIQYLGQKIFSVKKSFPRTLTNLLSSWMFTLYASENFNPLLDPFIPNNYNETEPLKNTLYDLIQYDTSIENPKEKIDLLLENLKILFKNQLINLNNYKKSKHHNTYNITKTNIIQIKNNEFKFYKFMIKVNFEIKDKRLNNILENLLIPIEEYEKLVKNYSGDSKNIDEYIWAILFRYQLLGSNNHQLGVKPDIMMKLNHDYKMNYECFASAINSTLNKFSSIYYDLEKYFGSYGSFYYIYPKEGVFGLNPPYQKDIMTNAIKRVLYFLKDADTDKRKLSFIITIPIWDIEGRAFMKQTYNNELPQKNIDYGDFEIISEIKKSPYHIATRMIPKENFTYMDHNFKLFKNKTIQNTYVIILSSDKTINPSHLLSYDFS